MYWYQQFFSFLIGISIALTPGFLFWITTQAHFNFQGETIQAAFVSNDLPAAPLNFSLAEKTLLIGEEKPDVLREYAAMEACQGINKRDTQEKVVALTFDDGPNGIYTSEILDILQKEQVRATFFVVGNEIAPTEERLIGRMTQDGHIVGVHSFSHRDLRTLSKLEREEEMEKTAGLIKRITEERPLLMRPPYGACNKETTKNIEDFGFTIITWSAMTNDYEDLKVTPQWIAQDILARVHPGAIIDLHDGGDNRLPTVQALPQIIHELKNQGYTFLTIPELLQVEAYANR